jgi:hypothetical protein
MEDSINTGHDAMAKLIHFTGRSLSPSGWTRINMSFGQRLRFVKTKRISHGVRHAVVKLIFFQVVLVLVSYFPSPYNAPKKWMLWVCEVPRHAMPRVRKIYMEDQLSDLPMLIFANKQLVTVQEQQEFL